MITEELTTPPSRESYWRTYWPSRLRLLGRLARLAFVGVVAATLAVGVVRVVRMIGLPDVGDPFEGVARPPAVRSEAFVLYDRAHKLLERHKDEQRQEQYELDPMRPRNRLERRAWLARNRDTLELFRRAAEYPVAFGGDPSRPGPAPPEFAGLYLLASQEVGRLEEDGDHAGAWMWLRACLRTTYHAESGGSVISRLHAHEQRGMVGAWVSAWSVKPEVDVGMLRRALADVSAMETLAPSDLALLESGYRVISHLLQSGHRVRPRNPNNVTIGRGGWQLPDPLGAAWWRSRRFLDSEPERSVRVVRLAFANWRAWLEQPAAKRPRPAIRSIVVPRRPAAYVEFFAPAPASLPAARRMSPERLAAWFDTADDARVPLAEVWPMFQRVRLQGRSGHASLVVRLAVELYSRERGEPPPSMEALVGPYLERLPDDGSSELDDGTTPTTQANPAAR